MIFTGLRIDMDHILEVLDRADESRNESVGNERLRPIKLADIALTRGEYPKCNCEDDKFGLVAGMTVHCLMRLGSGCTSSAGHVCPRLVRLRRIYGH